MATIVNNKKYSSIKKIKEKQAQPIKKNKIVNSYAKDFFGESIIKKMNK